MFVILVTSSAEWIKSVDKAEINHGSLTLVMTNDAHIRLAKEGRKK